MCVHWEGSTEATIRFMISDSFRVYSMVRNACNSSNQFGDVIEASIFPRELAKCSPAKSWPSTRTIGNQKVPYLENTTGVVADPLSVLDARSERKGGVALL
ncbi:hypothetical protein CEXT_725541 [Caerostris extrusa]|uniref:Uncharacterized protein n=1 Tax=Caerostris extrusa TaxID=172846 RepID=A0AAV4SAT7_CAEEX|nr:hypothetical protein CEXT_725541 [Caerostris extrusa]